VQWDVDVKARSSEARSPSGTPTPLRLGGRSARGGSAHVDHLATDDAPEEVRASSGTNLDRLRLLAARRDPANSLRLDPDDAPVAPRAGRFVDSVLPTR
jgi:hypothetical protein